jgi:acyl-CoA thioesterase
MNEPMKMTPEEIVSLMMSRDGFSQWLGLQIDAVADGYCKLHYTVRPEMLNGFASLHGGVMFSASDSAFAFACNTHGRITVAQDVSISFTRPAAAGEVLTVEAKELYAGHRSGLYDIRTTNERGELVAFFKGSAYRSSKPVE